MMTKEDMERLRIAPNGEIVPVKEEIEIKAGAQLDFAIAKAIGLKTAAMHHRPPSTREDEILGYEPDPDYPKSCLITPREWDGMRGVPHETCEGDVACHHFQPSIDLNAAFAAADSMDLFNCEVPPGYRRCLFRRDSDTWCFGGPGVSEEAFTPALAVCAAILEMAKPR